MNRYLPLMWFFMIPAVTVADDLLSCVDPDVVEAFLARGDRSTYQIVNTLPEELSALDYAEKFRLIGSLETARYTSVAFHSDRTPDEAMAMMEAALGEHGWVAVDDPRMNSRPNGFQETQSSSQRQIALCDASNSAMSLSSRNTDGGTIIHLSTSSSSRGNICRQEYRLDPYRDMGFTSDLMPNLYLPDGAAQLGSGHRGVIRSSGDDAETHVRITSDLGPERILDHFSNQLADQGWALDSTWFGRASIGSAWTYDKQGLPSTVGTLVLLEHSQGDYTAKFSMVAL